MPSRNVKQGGAHFAEGGGKRQTPRKSAAPAPRAGKTSRPAQTPRAGQARPAAGKAPAPQARPQSRPAQRPAAPAGASSTRPQARPTAGSQQGRRPQAARPATGNTHATRPVSGNTHATRPVSGNTRPSRPVSGGTNASRPVSGNTRSSRPVSPGRAPTQQAPARRPAAKGGAPRHAAQPQKPKRKYSRTAIVVLLVVLGVALAGGGLLVRRYLRNQEGYAPAANVEPGQAVTVEIPDGCSSREVLNILLQNGVVSSSSDFNREVQAQNAESSMKSGTYDFVTGSDAADVVKQLVSGPNSTRGQITIAEGLTVQKTADTLQDKLGISKEEFIAQAKASNYVADFPFLSEAKDDSLEGYLFGKTYTLKGETPTADDAIRTMLTQYKNEVSSLDFKTAEATLKETYGVTMSDYDVLTLASIIEKEALNDDDRQKIASVFYNRLKIGMALQSDATMGYVTGGEVTAEDLKTDSPYNTYLYPGLPPTPICSPSLASVQAALNPPQTDYLYFWITDSEHKFSETYDEHLDAVNGTSSESDSE